MSTDWAEEIEPGEDARFEALAQILARVQRDAARDGRKMRALHAKANAGMRARLEVLDVPATLRHGLFAAPRTYDAYVRFSSGAPRMQSDDKPDVRGVAIKVLGVEGKKIIPGLEDATTQDFLFIQSPAVVFRDPTEFVELVRIANGSRALALPRLLFVIGFARTFTILRSLVRALSTSGRSFAEQRFFTALPLRIGPHAAKLDLRALSSEAPQPAATGPERLGADLARRARTGSLVFELRAQLFVDRERTPIEDPTVEWQESIAPFAPVARLVIPAQDVESDEGKRVAAYIERLSFDPWHALVEHRPLGAMMRARNHAYRVSTTARGAIDERHVARIGVAA